MKQDELILHEFSNAKVAQDEVILKDSNHEKQQFIGQMPFFTQIESKSNHLVTMKMHGNKVKMNFLDNIQFADEEIIDIEKEKPKRSRSTKPKTSQPENRMKDESSRRK